ncbi:MAG TPA: methyltransferase domain-containing protein [Thermoanaerobaculia bacterium]|nr:methyltransferase domain-containing protein [Thermoanaerobaculia bacterium]
MRTDPDLYYPRRAPEYEEIYRNPERQADLELLRQEVPRLLAGQHVLEIACGTGYWTQWIAPAAASVLATDLSPEVIEQAREKTYPPDRVSFQLLDAYEPMVAPSRFDAVFAGFWWSHIPLDRLPRFLSDLRRRVGGGVLWVFLDNRYVEGSSIPIAREDDQGNTYQLRSLRDGSTFEVLKNFPSAATVRQILAADAEAVEVMELPFYWLAWGRTKETS